MPDTPSRSVHATIESTSTRKRAEESSRKFVVLSFPVYGNADLINLIETNVRGNPLDILFGESAQASLLRDDDEEEEEVEASVDGKPAKVRRRKTTNATRERLQALADAGKTNHAFQTQTDDEFCAKCGRASEDGVHVLQSWSERYNSYLTNPESSGFNHPGNAADSATDDADHGLCQPLTDEERVFVTRVQTGELNDELSETANSLIEEAQQTPALA